MTLKMINIPLNQQNIPFIAITLYRIRSHSKLTIVKWLIK